jgi:hypothetical protein
MREREKVSKEAWAILIFSILILVYATKVLS